MRITGHHYSTHGVCQYVLYCKMKFDSGASKRRRPLSLATHDGGSYDFYCPRTPQKKENQKKAFFFGSCLLRSFLFTIICLTQLTCAVMYLRTRRYVFLASLCLIMKLGCIALLLELQATTTTSPSSRHSYVGSDHPRTWDIGYLPPIRMNIEPTKHYQLSGYNADAEWAALAPHDGIIHLGPHRQPYSVSLFHQLRCLDIIRRDIVAVDWDSDSEESLPPKDEDHDTAVAAAAASSTSKFKSLSRHCLNYMRQMVLCRADLALDPVLGRGLEARVRPDTNQCVDWRRVYEELDKNQREHAQWLAAAE